MPTLLIITCIIYEQCTLSPVCQTKMSAIMHYVPICQAYCLPNTPRIRYVANPLPFCIEIIIVKIHGEKPLSWEQIKVTSHYKSHPLSNLEDNFYCLFRWENPIQIKRKQWSGHKSRVGGE